MPKCSDSSMSQSDSPNTRQSLLRLVAITLLIGLIAVVVQHYQFRHIQKVHRPPTLGPVQDFVNSAGAICLKASKSYAAGNYQAAINLVEPLIQQIKAELPQPTDKGPAAVVRRALLRNALQTKAHSLSLLHQPAQEVYGELMLYRNEATSLELATYLDGQALDLINNGLKNLTEEARQATLVRALSLLMEASAEMQQIKNPPISLWQGIKEKLALVHCRFVTGKIHYYLAARHRQRALEEKLLLHPEDVEAIRELVTVRKEIAELSAHAQAARELYEEIRQRFAQDTLRGSPAAVMSTVVVLKNMATLAEAMGEDASPIRAEVARLEAGLNKMKKK